MVILISAPGCTGKTLMAQRLLEIYKIPYLSADHLKMGLYRADMNCGFTPTSPDEQIERVLWPILKGIIQTNIENGQSIIIEGCYIFPRRIAELQGKYLDPVIPVFMGFSESYVEQNHFSGIVRYRSAIERRGYPDDRTTAQIAQESARLKAECTRCGVRYFEIGRDYAEDTAAIYRWVDSEARQKREA